MSDQLEARLREAFADRADYGMAYTDTQKELLRFKNRLAGDRRTRRIRLTIAIIGAAAATAATVALVLALANGRTKATTVPSTHPSRTPASAATLPVDYPAGTWIRVGRDHQQGRLTFSDSAMARLQDVVGFNDEPLGFPAPHRMTFGPPVDRFYCTKRGTYTYTISAHLLHFHLVHDDCTRRHSFLTLSAWQEVHS